MWQFQRIDLKLFILRVVFLGLIASSCGNGSGVTVLSQPSDYNIAVLLDLHFSKNGSCDGDLNVFAGQEYIGAQYGLNVVRDKFPGFGLHFVDTCSNPEHSLSATLDLLRGYDYTARDEGPSKNGMLLGVISKDYDARTSKILNAMEIPHLSFGESNNGRDFPFQIQRSLYSEHLRIQGLAALIKELQVTTINLLVSAKQHSRLENLSRLLEQQNVCIKNLFIYSKSGVSENFRKPVSMRGCFMSTKIVSDQSNQFSFPASTLVYYLSQVTMYPLVSLLHKGELENVFRLLAISSSSPVKTLTWLLWNEMNLSNHPGYEAESIVYLKERRPLITEKFDDFFVKSMNEASNDSIITGYVQQKCLNGGRNSSHLCGEVLNDDLSSAPGRYHQHVNSVILAVMSFYVSFLDVISPDCHLLNKCDSRIIWNKSDLLTRLNSIAAEDLYKIFDLYREEDSNADVMVWRNESLTRIGNFSLGRIILEKTEFLQLLSAVEPFRKISSSSSTFSDYFGSVGQRWETIVMLACFVLGFIAAGGILLWVLWTSRGDGSPGGSDLSIALLVAIILMYFSGFTQMFTTSTSEFPSWCIVRYISRHMSYTLCYAIIMAQVIHLHSIANTGIGGRLKNTNLWITIIAISGIQLSLCVQFLVMGGKVYEEKFIDGDLKCACVHYQGISFLCHNAFNIIAVLLTLFCTLYVKLSLGTWEELMWYISVLVLNCMIWSVTVGTHFAAASEDGIIVTSVSMFLNASLTLCVLYLPKLVRIHQLKSDEADSDSVADEKSRSWWALNNSLPFYSTVTSEDFLTWAKDREMSEAKNCKIKSLDIQQKHDDIASLVTSWSLESRPPPLPERKRISSRSDSLLCLPPSGPDVTLTGHHPVPKKETETESKQVCQSQLLDRKNGSTPDYQSTCLANNENQNFSGPFQSKTEPPKRPPKPQVFRCDKKLMSSSSNQLLKLKDRENSRFCNFNETCVLHY